MNSPPFCTYQVMIIITSVSHKKSVGYQTTEKDRKSTQCLYRTHYYFSMCVCQFPCISATSVITETVSQCQVMQKVCGTASTWVQYILYLFQLRCITFWIMVSNYLQISMPGWNRTLRYTGQ